MLDKKLKISIVNGLLCLFIVSTFTTVAVGLEILTYPGFTDLLGEKKFKTCEGYEDNIDPSGLKVYKHADQYVVDGTLVLRKNFNSPVKVLVQLTRPDESPIQAFKTKNYCSNLGNRAKDEYELDLYYHLLFSLMADNRYNCPIKKGSYGINYNIDDYLVSRLAKLIDQEGSVRMEYGDDACIEYTFKRVSGSRPEHKRKAGTAPSANPAEGKTGGLQKFIKFLKGLFSS